MRCTDVKDRKTELKIKYGNIYSVSDSSGTEYLFRALSLEEIYSVETYISKGSKSLVEIENFCLETCVLEPVIDDPDDVMPGTAKQIAEDILRVSGVTDSRYILDSMVEVRDQLSNDIILSIKTYIISAMPSYTDTDLDKFSIRQLLEKLVLSEKILQLQSDLAGLGSEIILQFEQVDAQEEGPEEVAEEEVTKEELLRRIKKDNNEGSSPFTAYDNSNGLKEFQGFDAELLKKMEGTADSNDPIAQRLHGKK